MALGWVVPWVVAGPPGTGPAERHQPHRQGTGRSGGHVILLSFRWRYSARVDPADPVQRITDPCFFVDPVIQRCVMDGIAGGRSDLAAAPSSDVANGAPTGADATDEIVLTWVDGRDGLNDEHVHGQLLHQPGGHLIGPDGGGAGSTGRGNYSPPALSPDGTDLYLGLQRLHHPVPQLHHQSSQPGRGGAGGPGCVDIQELFC